MTLAVNEPENGCRAGFEEKGAVLLSAILIVSMLMVLSALSLNLATQEIHSTAASEDEAAARYVARSGVDLVVQWFHDPASAPADWGRTLLVKSFNVSPSGASFFDSSGRSQFTGTWADPDLLIDATEPEHDRLLNDPDRGWFRALGKVGRVLQLRMYGPARPGYLATVGVTAERRGIFRSFTAQLGTHTIPPMRAGTQVGVTGLSRVASGPGLALPLWVHWGDVKVVGDAHLGLARDLPVKSAWASVTGRSYAEMPVPEDRWLDLFIGGAALLAASSADASPLPSNVFPHQDPIPGLRLDSWEYAVLKSAARRFGSYYVLGDDGHLYARVVEPGSRRSPDEVFESRLVGEHRGLVFIDTPDQRAPALHNLRRLSVRAPYAEGIFVVNAHLVWQPRGTARTVPALSPPPEGESGLADRVPVQLTGINLQGVLVTAGDLVFSGRPRVHGALSVGGRLIAESGGADRLEVWFSHELGSGLVRGMPLVYVVPGTFQEVL